LLDGLPVEETPQACERARRGRGQRLPEGLHGQAAVGPEALLHVLRSGRHRGRHAHGYQDPN